MYPYEIFSPSPNINVITTSTLILAVLPSYIMRRKEYLINPSHSL
jgi:hypothetical protein